MMFGFLRNSRPSIPSGQRIYAIGDVHGRLDLLQRILAAIEQDNTSRGEANVSVVFLGDLVDRGPDSREVVARVRRGFTWARTITLMGNHEAIMLEALDGQKDRLAQWLRFGGEATLLSWGVPISLIETGSLDCILDRARSVINSEERNWFYRLAKSYTCGSYYFVHAGIRPGVQLAKQADNDRLWIREEFLASRRHHGAMIVHGHSITGEVDEAPNRIGLDTGAYKTGCLTGMGFEEDRRWIIDTRT